MHQITLELVYTFYVGESVVVQSPDSIDQDIRYNRLRLFRLYIFKDSGPTSRAFFPLRRNALPVKPDESAQIMILYRGFQILLDLGSRGVQLGPFRVRIPAELVRM